MSEQAKDQASAEEVAKDRSADRLGLRVLASAICGALMFLGVPNYDVWWFGLFGWIPLLWAIEGQSPRRAFLFGWVAGTLGIFFGFFWLTELLVRFGGFPKVPSAFLALLFSAWTGLQWAFFAFLVAWLRRRGIKSTLWIAPIAWVAVEVVLPHVFPTYIALMWCWQPLWIQTAELGGVATVSFCMVAINAALYESGREFWRTRKVALGPTLAAVAWLVGVPAYGALRLHQVEAAMAEAPHAKVGVVQGNFGIETYSSFRTKARLLYDMQRMSAALEAEGAELILWGETAYPYLAFWRQSTSDLRVGDRRKLRRGFTVPIIAGVITRDRTRENRYAWNSAWVIDEEGKLGDRYDKVYPLIFGEWVPFIDPEWYLRKVPSASYINRGDGPGVLRVDEWRFGGLICYEDILPEFVRQTANLDVHALVNLTNDSWFGLTNEQGEHLGLSVFRSVETRRPLLRSVNAGISAHVDPTGRVVQSTAATDSDIQGYRGPDGFVADVAMLDPKAKTPYMLTGHLFGALCWLGVIAGFVRTRKSRNPD